MPYEVRWYEQDRVIQTVITGDITIPELEAMRDELINDYLTQGQAPIHIISDARQMAKFPSQPLVVMRLTEPWLRHPNMGWAIVVGKTNPMLNFLAAAVTNLLHVNYRMTNSVEEAVETLETLDRSLKAS